MEKLAKVPLLSELTSEQRERVVRTGRELGLQRGEVLFHEGERAGGLFALLKGRMKLVRYSPEGKELLLHLVHPGQTFAEAALFGRETYPATAEAAVASSLWLFPRDGLFGLMRSSPELGLAMLASVSQWTRRLVNKLDLLTQRRVEERLAIFLMARAPQRPLRVGDVIPLAEPKNLIAAQIGTAPEVLSRTFRRLQEARLIDVGGDGVSVLDPLGLRELADWIGEEEPGSDPPL